jgi:hypothetical protein
MQATQLRILCVDSSDARRVRLHALLEEAGFDAWMTSDIGDALSLAKRLPLDAVVTDQSSTLGREKSWEKLMVTRSALPVLVHSAEPSLEGGPAGSGEVGAVRSGNPEMIMAILTLLLGPDGRLEPVEATYHRA